MRIFEMKNWKNQSRNFLGGFLSASMLLFGAASCSSGGGEEGAEVEEGLAETEEVGIGAESELATNEGVGGFDQWDTNDDQMWDENEFETVANDEGFYDEWDADNNGNLTDDELYEGTYGVYDENDDNQYTQEEFNAWNTAWGGDYDYNTWDTNDDNVLDYNEYNAGIGEAGVYDDWDADNDNLYSEDEVYGGLYDTWDYNNDNYLAADEYNTIGYNYWGF